MMKSALVWIGIIGVVLLALQLINPSNTRTQEISFSQFYTEGQAGKYKTVTLTGVEGDSLHGMIAQTRDVGLGPEVKRRILLGAFCLSKGYYDAFYLKALKVRTLITQDFAKAFQKVDLIATPVSPSVAFKLDDKLSDPMAMYLADIFAVAPSLAALPCLSIPSGFAPPPGEEGHLPVGMQLIGPPLSDVKLLEWGHAFQQVTDHHLQSPPLDC